MSRIKCTDEIDEEYTVQTESSRRSKLECDKEMRSLKAYSVDTYLFNYAPRLLTVPSKEYQTLQCALDSLKPRHGGYIIELIDESMIYTIDKPIDPEMVDYLTIRGKGMHSHPFNGRSYIQRVNERIDVRENGNTRIVNMPIEPLYRFMPSKGCNEQPSELCPGEYQDEVFGDGLYDINLRGNNFIVNSNLGQSPNFDTVPKGSRIVIISSDGTANGLVTATVTGTDRNSLTFGNVSGIINVTSDNAMRDNFVEDGTGFAFVPTIRVEVNVQGISIETLKSLTLENIELHAQPMFYVNSVLGSVTLKNCWISNCIVYRGRYHLPVPNLYTGLVVLWPTSRGEAYCQTLYSLDSMMQGITAYGFWSYCFFVNMAHAVELLHGCTVNFTGSQFIRCCLALSAEGMSHVVLTNVTVAHSRCAVMLTYKSMASSLNTSIPGVPRNLLMGPWFIRNIYVIVTFRDSEFICPMTSMIHNTIPFIVDGKVLITIESNALATPGYLNSMITVSANPFVPSSKRLRCTTLADIVNWNELDAWAIASPSFISEMSNLGNGFSVTADETINRIIDEMRNNNNDRDRSELIQY